MDIQKLLAVICAATLAGAGSLKAQSADTDAQAKAREALHQKIAELDGQPQAAPSNTVSQPVMTAPAATAPPVVVTPAPAPAPAVTGSAVVTTAPSGALSPDQQQKVIEAMRQRMAELNGQPAAASPVPAPAPAYSPAPATVYTPAPAPAPAYSPTPAYTPPPAAVVVSPAPAPAPVGSQLSPEDQARVFESLHATKAALDAKDQPAIAPAANTPMAAAPAIQATGIPGNAPSAMAAPMISGSKQQRLAELLQLYKSDKITPAEYHQQRAKIVAEPDADH